ncbi:phosphoribosylamine--glycine ligase [Pantoea sp. Aalb]|uniref:phosphoribosylamine--glycine ligase n=1 Tax=Pantoea sp. Aalb TaxID=2576762 RepID=UPI0013238D12|nr:phosphoribosylamine--glycine ligase [Pantoea sp. Aalb]MXP67965.1 phosphoribosylamine--glycine ligase [Pantoea sp. Aalb]
MKILVIGNGAREHALAWKAAQSALVDIVFVAPGNAGTALELSIKNVNIQSNDILSLLKFAKQEKIDLTIVGPEVPLVMGIVDVFENADLKIFGPTKSAAQLEGSKIFAKDFLVRYNIPTAEYKYFTTLEPALIYIRKKELPIVIKADGLTAGKGVFIAMTHQEAENIVKNMISDNYFGDSGHRIIIEDFLDGEEVSFTVMVDGNHILPIATSQDHKRVGNNDTGVNTGGMGAYSPAPVVTDNIHHNIINNIIWPTINGMKNEGNIYTGFLYVGLMIDKLGNPKVIEFNCRLGDPETQPIMLRLQSDLVKLCLAAIDGQLDSEKIQWNPYYALGVVMASNGYPNQYNIGSRIYGLPLTTIPNGKIFHAGTILKNNVILTNGGRVLCITAMGKDILAAKKNTYAIVKKIFWDGSFYRQDIGYRAINRKY